MVGECNTGGYGDGFRKGAVVVVVAAGALEGPKPVEEREHEREVGPEGGEGPQEVIGADCGSEGGEHAAKGEWVG